MTRRARFAVVLAAAAGVAAVLATHGGAEPARLSDAPEESDERATAAAPLPPLSAAPSARAAPTTSTRREGLVLAADREELGGASPALVEAVRAALARGESSAVARVFVEAAALGREAAPLRPIALSLLDDESRGVRDAAASLLGAIGSADEAATRALSRVVVEDRDPSRTIAAGALASLGPEGVAALLRLAKSEPGVEARLAALRALAAADVPSRDVVPLALAILEERVGDGWKGRALDLIASLRPAARAPDVLPALARLPADASPRLRLDALRATATLDGDDPAVVGVLLAALAEDDDRSAVAASLLGNFPAQAERIVPPLVERLVESERARSAAFSSLRALVAEAPTMKAAVERARARAGEEPATWLDALLSPSAAPPSER